jgi:phosphotransferase system enzyme I (PtsP)
MALAEKEQPDTSAGMSLGMSIDSRVHVHERGDGTLDGLFRLIAVAERHESLSDVLTSMCGDVAAIARVEVASIYVREDGPDGQRFTMRGNVGFPAGAVGNVHLRPGEGITGFVADRLRPVSVAIADRDQHFKYIPGLGEERFPALLAVPVLRAGSAAGVLVLQRRQTAAFSPEEVVLASALAAVINHALERVADREQRRAHETDRRAARLRGVSLSGGAAMGRAEVLPTLAALARGGPAAAAAPRAGVDAVIERLQADLGAAAAHARAAGRGPAAGELASLALILDDRRFRSRLQRACAAAAPLEALSALAREYARAPFQAPAGDDAAAELMGERAAEIEDLCVLGYAALWGERPLVRTGAIVVTERLRVFSALAAIARGASAFVVDGDVPAGGGAAALVAGAGLPLLASVTGVFSWARPDDLLVVDADAGIVRVNPSATAVARFRRARR